MRYNIARVYIGLICMLQAEQLYFEDFSSGSWPAGYSYEGNWIISNSWDGNDTPPAAVYNWSPQQVNFNHNIITDYIDVGYNDAVLVRFDFALDFFQDDSLNGLKISYDGGLGWVDVLDYFIGPGAGDVDVSRRTESFTANIGPGTDLKVRWTAYGDDSWAINGWVVDNITVLTLPKLTYVSIESSNQDSATATASDTTWINFTADSDFENDPYVQINGTPCTVDNLGGRNWVAYHTVTETDPDGPIEFTIDFTDMNSIEGLTVKETTDGSTVIVDNSDPPDFTVGDINAAGGTVAPNIWNSTNTAIQLEVSVPQDSSVESFNYTVGNSLLFDGLDDKVVVNGVDNSLLTSSLTIEVWIKPLSWADYEGFLSYATDDDEGETQSGFGFSYYSTGWRFYLKTETNSINYTNMVEASTPANQWTHLAATYNGSQVVIYRNGSALDSTDAMDNIDWTNSPSNLEFGSYTKDGITRYFDGYIDEVRLWSSVRSADEIKASRGIDLNSDESGLIGYWKIDEGEGGTAIDETSSGYNCTINGATWALENSPLDFKTPVYNTGVIVGSSFQLRGRVSDNDFEGFGSKDTITLEDFNSGTKLVSAVEDSFESITGFAHGETAQLSAFLFDIAGNHTLGDTSETNTMVDIIANAPTTASIQSDNTFSHLAKTGNIVTVSMEYDEDVEVPDVTFHGNNAESETDLGGEEFQAVYTLSGGEPEGDIDFSMLVTDYLGNQNTYSGSTDGSIVVYDKTSPVVTPVIIRSTNEDTQWAKLGDTVRVDFIGNEILYETDVTLAGSSVTLYDSTGADYVGSSECVGGDIVIEDLKLWLDANDVDGDGISEGMDEATLNGSDVAIWTDKSGNGADVIEVAGKGIPTLVQNQFNGQSALQFNKSEEDVLIHDLGASNWTATEYSLFIVFQQIGTPTTYDSFFSNGDAANNNYFQITQLSGKFKFFNNDVTIEFEPWDNNLKLYGIIANSEGTSTIVGGDIANYNASTSGRNFDKYNINRNRSANRYNNSYITEVLLYDRDLNGLELTKTYKYLGNKYGQSFKNDTTIVYTKKEMTDGDPEGKVAINFLYNDCTGNNGITISETTDDSYVIFDMTPPSGFTVGSVLSTGGNVVENAWNSTNTGLDVTVPVENDTTLRNGWIQIWAKVGNNVFEKLGDSITITNSDVGTDKLNSFTMEQVEAITGFAEEDTLTLKAIMSDRPGNETEGSQSINRLVIDQVLPTMVGSHIESNNADSTKARIDNVITLTFQADELVEPPTMTISGGSGTVTDLGSFNWSGTYTMQETDDEGVVSFTVAIIDARGNPADGFTSTSDESQVVFDKTRPELNVVQLSTNNSWNQYWAKENDYGRIYTNSSEDLLTLACTFNGNVTTDHWYSAHEFDLGYTFSGTDTDGLVVYEIAFVDSAGNLGDTVRASTNNTFIVFDKTPPANFMVGDVSATGGNAVATFWNSTNTSLDVIVPIESDSTLDSGRVQIWAKIGTNDFEILGDSSFILFSEVGSTKTMSILGDSVREITGFTENEIVTVKAYMFDIPGNETEGTESTTTLLIDETPPSLISVSYESNFSDSSLATVGHVVTLTFETDVAIQTPIVTISMNTAAVTDLGNNQWQATYTMQDDDTDGIIPFEINSITDIAGNPNDGTTATTDESIVIFDNTQPTLNTVRIASNNPDSTWAKVGDTITVTFIAEELLTEQVVTVVTQPATIFNLGSEKYIAKYEMTDSDPEGDVAFEILVTDSVGLISDPISETTNLSSVEFDKTLPTLDYVSIQSTNSNNTSIGITGDDVILTFTPVEPLLTDSIVVTIAGEPAILTQDGDNYIATLTLSGDEPGGILSYAIDFKDRAGNLGIQVISTTDNSYVNHDIIPPEILAVSIFSNNSDTTWAKPGDSVYVKFVANEELDNLNITISGTSSDYLYDGVVTYNGYHIMDDEDEEGIISFNISYTDLGGETGPDADSTTDESIVRYDKTLPEVFNVRMVSNNSMGDSAGIGDIDSVFFTSTEDQRNVIVLISDSSLTPVQEGLGFIATRIMNADDTDGWITFSITLEDSAGNSTGEITETDDGSGVWFDGTPPLLNPVSFTSTNENDQGLAILGDTLFLDFTSNEPLRSLSVFIAGLEADSIENQTRTPYRAWHVLDGSEEEGYISFQITFADFVGNPGDTVVSTTDETSILFDITPPADFEIDTVYVSGGTVVEGYWNASNDTVIIKIPVPENDETLIGGIYQPQLRFDSGDFTPLGNAVLIDSVDLGGFKSINITESDGFIENANAEFTALARDKAGNETMGSSNNTTFHIDETFPLLTNVNIHSDNILDTNWATVLNNISLEFMSSEGLSSPVIVMFLDTLQSSSENTGSIWIGSRSINENDLEGLLPFSITFSDSAGNEGNPISESTDGSSVNIDLTSPIISDLLEGRSGEDIDYYNSSDSITLYWNHSDNISGIRDAFIAFGTDSNTTDIIGWTLSSNDPLAGLGGLSLANDGIYFGGVFVRDSSGNLSDTIRGNGVYIDTEQPTTGIINDGQWILEMDYTPDSTSLEYTWNGFSDNVGINYYELAVGTNDDTTNIQDWYHTDSTESMTLDGLDLERDTLYYTYLRAIDSASNKSITIKTDGIYFDDSEPKVIKITPDFNDSSGVLSVLRDDTISIKFNRLIYFYDLEIHSSVDSNLITEESYADSVITINWNTSLASNDTLIVYLDSALAYNSLFVSDTLYFYSHLWGDLNYDYDITLEDILLFNQSWPETDLAPFSDDPPHVRPAPDGDANLIDLVAFAKMWQWKYFKLSFDTTGNAARITNDLDVKAQGKKVFLKIPENTFMAEILIGESNLDIEKITLVNPTGTAFLFRSLDTLNHLVQFSLADYRGFDSTLTLNIPETESHIFSAKVQYQFLDNKGIELGKAISYLNVDILPDKFTVFNNYPNPFNQTTTIRYDLPERRDVYIKIIDMLGRTVNTVDYNQTQAGRHSFTWHGKNALGKKVSTGIYFFQLTAGENTRIQKMLLLK